MKEAFDPYHKWLGIPPGKRPPDHYELLGLTPFEEDVDAILNAADRRMSHVKSFATGPHAAISQFILNQLSQARVCLANAEKKSQYDKELRVSKSLSSLPSSSGSRPRPTARRSAGDAMWWQLLLVVPLLVLLLGAVWWAIDQGMLSIPRHSKPKPPPRNSRFATDSHAAEDTPVTTNRRSPRKRNSSENDTQAAAVDEPEYWVRPEASGGNKPPSTSPSGTQPLSTVNEQPLTDDFIAELDDAFMALGDHQYAEFKRHQRSAQSMVEAANLNRLAAEANLTTLDNIGKAYEEIWRLAGTVIPTLKKREKLVSKRGERVWVLRVTDNSLTLREGRQQNRYVAQQVAGIKVYPEMTYEFILYLANRALPEDPSSRQAIDFFESVNPKSLPESANERWGQIMEKWKESQGS